MVKRKGVKVSRKSSSVPKYSLRERHIRRNSKSVCLLAISTPTSKGKHNDKNEGTGPR